MMERELVLFAHRLELTFGVALDGQERAAERAAWIMYIVMIVGPTQVTHVYSLTAKAE